MTNDSWIWFRGLDAERPAAPTARDQAWGSTDNGSQYFAKNTAGVLSWQAGSGGGSSLSYSSAFLSSNVTLTNANQYYDVLSLSLAAGTWYITCGLTFKWTPGLAQFTAKLWDGTTTTSALESTSISTEVNSLTLVGVVVPGSTTTYKVSMASNGAGSVVLAAPGHNSPGNYASWMVAVRIA